MRSISPEGAPVPDLGLTSTVIGTGWPCCAEMDFEESVVNVASFCAVGQPSTTLAAFTLPRPVDMSTPLVAGYPGSSGTALLPVVTSRKKQFPACLGLV